MTSDEEVDNILDIISDSLEIEIEPSGYREYNWQVNGISKRARKELKEYIEELKNPKSKPPRPELIFHRMNSVSGWVKSGFLTKDELMKVGASLEYKGCTSKYEYYIDKDTLVCYRIKK